MKTTALVTLFAAAGIALAALIYLLFAAALSWAWNAVVPSTFGGPTLDILPAFALLIVLSILRSFLFGSRTSK